MAKQSLVIEANQALFEKGSRCSCIYCIHCIRCIYCLLYYSAAALPGGAL